MSIYIDSYSIKILGQSSSKSKNAPLVDKMNMSSEDGMNSKAFIDLVEQIGDSHDANCEIDVQVIMKQHRY
tara:strand:+ start:417 stop:629 length:213 start_codon:yes stop_codon:yes gene_type:complete